MNWRRYSGGLGDYAIGDRDADGTQWRAVAETACNYHIASLGVRAQDADTPVRILRLPPKMLKHKCSDPDEHVVRLTVTAQPVEGDAASCCASLRCWEFAALLAYELSECELKIREHLAKRRGSQ